jgi:hypothetical protein
MSDSDDRALEVLRRIMATPEPNLWPLGTWLQHEETPEDRLALKTLDLSLGYPEGGQIPLILTGWEERSVWGFDPQDDAYFAQLWRDGSPSEHPDAWICGRGRVDGREFALTTTRLLAQEVAEATGRALSQVCKAMIRGHHRISSDTSEPDDL